MRSTLLSLLFASLLASGSLQLVIECPAYVAGIFDEQVIIDKFAKDIASGNVKTIHTK